MAERFPPQRDVVERHLSRAWQAAAPAPGLQQQVRARLSSSTAATAGALALRMGSRTQPMSAWSSLRASGKLGVIIGVGVFGLGLFSGYLIRDSREGVAASGAAIAAIEAVSPPLPSQDGLVADHSADVEVVVAREATEPPRREVESERPTGKPRRSVGGRRSHEPAAASPAVASTQLEPAKPSDELALLGRADRAVRTEDAALALALIGELDARHPDSKLMEERRAIELLAHCEAGATDAKARSERFLRAHPGSVYGGRIRETCPSIGNGTTLPPR
jgi:hypothetical protein